MTGWGKRMVGADSTFARRDGSKSARRAPPTPQTGRRRAAGKFAFFAKTPPARSAPGVPKGWPCAGPRAAKIVSPLVTATERRAVGARIPATVCAPHAVGRALPQTADQPCRQTIGGGCGGIARRCMLPSSPPPQRLRRGTSDPIVNPPRDLAHDPAIGRQHPCQRGTHRHRR